MSHRCQHSININTYLTVSSVEHASFNKILFNPSIDFWYVPTVHCIPRNRLFNQIFICMYITCALKNYLIQKRVCCPSSGKRKGCWIATLLFVLAKSRNYWSFQTEVSKVKMTWYPCKCFRILKNLAGLWFLHLIAYFILNWLKLAR